MSEGSSACSPDLVIPKKDNSASFTEERIN